MSKPTDTFPSLMPSEALNAFSDAHKLTAATLDRFTRVHLEAADRYRQLNLKRVRSLYGAESVADFMHAQRGVVEDYSAATTQYAEAISTAMADTQSDYADLWRGWAGAAGLRWAF